MELTGLHLLLTYRCTMECDHCFVWSSPEQTRTMTLRQVRTCLREGVAIGTVRSIYFEGGEPFLAYPILVKGVAEAHRAGFDVGIVSNGFWAASVEDALEWLEPFVGLVADLSLSKDEYHWDEGKSVDFALAAAESLGIPAGIISIADPEAENAIGVTGQLPAGESRLMFRGRAAKKLAHRATGMEFAGLTTCPYEDLRYPGRVHVDPLGCIHLCQGIVLGNLFEEPLEDIVARFDPDTHPIVGPLLRGGPALLTKQYAVEHGSRYGDACHLCYETRTNLRRRFPDVLQPDEMYGV